MKIFKPRFDTKNFIPASIKNNGSSPHLAKWHENVRRVDLLFECAIDTGVTGEGVQRN
jgi:hypothetical protein